ncbi:hypothetical protein [uncultured Neptuniibacter sp.]|uniref:hypothetical protein n=1 Tax=uncultured Neptuniibacter sp. TaxID=502143 RepID=UPI00261FC9A5|nr:hypothetical protein [uncultured Neptuniibacter sp.]
MKQRINLFDPAQSKTPFDAFSFSGSIKILTGCVVILSLLGASLSYYASVKEDQLAALNARKQATDAAVLAEQQRFSKRHVRPEIVAEQERLKNAINDRQYLRSLLQGVDPQVVTPFSRYLSALAHSSQPESWLTYFSFVADARSFEFHGKAMKGAQVPALIDAMAQTDALAGMQINSLAVDSEAENVQFNAIAELPFHE